MDKRYMKDAQHEQREMQIKTILRYHPAPVRMAITKKPTSSKCWRGCGEENPPVLLGPRVEPLWKTEWIFNKNLGFPHSSVGKESACSAEDPSSIPESLRSAGEGIGYPLQYSGACLVAQTVKNWPAMRETWVWSLGWEDPLERGKATHSRILTWSSPWTIQSMGSQRVRHSWATFISLH